MIVEGDALVGSTALVRIDFKGTVSTMTSGTGADTRGARGSRMIVEGDALVGSSMLPNRCISKVGATPLSKSCIDLTMLGGGDRPFLGQHRLRTFLLQKHNAQTAPQMQYAPIAPRAPRAIFSARFNSILLRNSTILRRILKHFQQFFTTQFFRNFSQVFTTQFFSNFSQFG